MQGRSLVSIIRIGLLCVVATAVACSVPSGKPPKVLFISKNTENPYHIAIGKGVLLEAEDKKYEVEVAGPTVETDVETQRKALRRAASSREYAAVILEPNHSTALDKELEALERAGVPLVVVDTPIESLSAEQKSFCGFVGTDNYQGGVLAAEYLANEIRGGNVVVIRGLSSQRTSIDREHGFTDAIQKRYNWFKVAAVLDGKWDAETALSAYRKFTSTRQGRVDAVFALNDDMAVAIAEYVSGMARPPVVIGFNGSITAQQSILHGKLKASVIQTPQLMGSMALSRAHDCIHGISKGSKFTHTPTDVIFVNPDLTTLLSLRNDIR